jgi:hypothetical protein
MLGSGTLDWVKEECMATRAERFKAAAARNGSSKRSKASTKAGARGGAGPAAGTGAGAAQKKRTPSRAKLMSNAMPKGERRYGGYSTSARNKKRNPGEATYELEDNRAPRPPSRKSTRKSTEHVKLGTALTSRHQLKMNSPQNKHDRRGV